MPVLLVLDGAKTVSHRVYSLDPKWVDEFERLRFLPVKVKITLR